MSQQFSFVVIVGIVANILSVVGIVICNKYIIEVDGYNFSVFLSFLHFAFTALGTRVMLQMNYFTQNTAPLSGILPVAIGSLLSVAFMNLNLAYNSVGFYQVKLVQSCIYLLLDVYYIQWCFFIVVKTGLHSIYVVCTICGIQSVCESYCSTNTHPNFIWCWICHRLRPQLEFHWIW